MGFKLNELTKLKMQNAYTDEANIKQILKLCKY